MPEIGMSGSMSGDGKRGVAERPKLPRPSSTLPKRQFAAVQRYGRYRWNTGRSVDAADTAAPGPEGNLALAPAR
jgi:hypothetical protein